MMKILMMVLSFYSLSLLAFEVKNGDFYPVEQELRFNIPFNEWPTAEFLVLKGDVFVIEKDFLFEGKQTSLLEKMDFYDSAEMKGKPVFSIKSSSIMQNDMSVCGTAPVITEASSRHISTCGQRSCQEHVKQDLPASITVWHPFARMSDSDTLKKCRFDLKFVQNSFVFGSHSSSEAYYFPNVSYTAPSDFVKVQVNGKTMFLDTRPCKKHPTNCYHKKIEKSLYEERLVQVQKIIKEESLESFSVLIKTMRPCVLKNDKKCILNFFLTPNDVENFTGSDLNYPTLSITQDDVEELKECLQYKKLLPHLLGSKGIRKVCIFGSTWRKGADAQPGLSLAYPEAVRSSNDSGSVTVNIEETK